MPEYGLLSKDKLPFSVPAIAPPYPSPPWQLDDARVLVTSFEIDKQVALDWLPPGLSRPYPPYAHIFVANFPKSPVGPFSVAMQMIVCRLALLARAHPVQMIVDNADALIALREVWGFPAKIGKVSLEQQDNGDLLATVERPAGQRLARVTVTGIEDITENEMRFDPMMNTRLVRSPREGEPPLELELLQIDPKYTIKKSQRGQGAVIYPTASDADPWHLLQSRFHVATIYGVCDIELGFNRYVESFELPKGEFDKIYA